MKSRAGFVKGPFSQSHHEVTQVRGGKWNHRAEGQPGTKKSGNKVEVVMVGTEGKARRPWEGLGNNPWLLQDSMRQDCDCSAS